MFNTRIEYANISKFDCIDWYGRTEFTKQVAYDKKTVGSSGI